MKPRLISGLLVRAARRVLLALLPLLAVLAVLAGTLPAVANEPPAIQDPGLYRGRPGAFISVSLDVDEPDGDGLTFEASDLPDGSSFDPDTGMLDWTPDIDQLGSFHVPVSVTDDGAPPLSDDATLTFAIDPPDSCVDVVCDPATGCTATSLPLDQDCCEGEPAIRVSEPDVSCPAGRALLVGRNEVGFGTLASCDRLLLAPFGQGGINMRVHIAARCINLDEPVTVDFLLETADRYLDPGDPSTSPLIDNREEISELTLRPDGFAQQLAVVSPIPDLPRLNLLEDAEAQLTVTLTDGDGVELVRRLRVTLTSDSTLADIPDPEEGEDVIASEASCVGCHRPLVQGGGRFGIEEAHPWGPALDCADCHGGDAGASLKRDAHVQVEGSDLSANQLRLMTSDELDNVPLDYLRFVNPGDLRVASLSCGDAGCHPTHVETTPRSTMATYGGHYTLPRFMAGSQDRSAIYAAVDITDDDYDAASAPPGAIEHFQALRGPAPGADRSTPGALIDDYLPKACPTCHLKTFGSNSGPGTYRSSGCTACHMVYADAGLSQSDDPQANITFPPHPVKHQLTSAIPTEQCAHCHFQGGRIGLAYRGIREGGFGPDATPEHGVTLGQSLYGHDANYYFEDEDDTNLVDETPPDLHHDAGMVCADCHVGVDVHGDDHLYSSERHQVGIRCEDCHGTVRQAIQEDPADGLFKNSKGSPLALRRDDRDRIWLQPKMQEDELFVPQVQVLLELGINSRMTNAMGVNEEGFSHTDSLECYTCHSSWQLACLGCHVTLDDTGKAKNLTTGEQTTGAILGSRDTYDIQSFSLGMNERGKLSPLCNSMSMFLSYRDENGNDVYTDKVRRTLEGKKGFGWNPFHFHTVTRKPKDCTTCHYENVRRPNAAVVARTYGFGDGSVMVEDDVGEIHDLTQFLDSEGELISTFPHPGTGPVPADMRERALAVVLPEPGLALGRLTAILMVGLWIQRRRRSGFRLSV